MTIWKDAVAHGNNLFRYEISRHAYTDSVRTLPAIEMQTSSDRLARRVEQRALLIRKALGAVEGSQGRNRAAHVHSHHD